MKIIDVPRCGVARALVAAGCCFLWVSLACATESADLATNPFDRPAWIRDAREAAPSAVIKTRRQPLDLRATLSAGPESLANVAGKVVGIGEQVDGYRLIAVGDGEATFEIGGEIIKAAVNRDNSEDEDVPD